jgi:hypothetical protein
MTFSEITADIDFLCGSTSASYPLADKTRNVNIAYNDVARLIWDSAGGWQYDDSNATTLPIATTTLVHGQKDYALPSTLQRLERVEVLDSSGDYQKLTQIDWHDLSLATTEYQSDNGLPNSYDLVGSSVMLYPSPSSASVTVASGLKVYFSREVTEFTTGSTGSPGFAKSFHRILSYAAAIDFVQDENTRRNLVGQKARLENGLTKFYSHRNVERRDSVRPAGKKVWRQYI